MDKIKADLWFDRDEYSSRISKVQKNINKRNLDALLVFFPENVTWSTGFYTRGYSSFQFVIIPASGEPFLVCRDVEEFYIKKTFSFSGYSLWCDSDDKEKFASSIIQKIVGKNASIAIEEMAWPLSVNRYMNIKRALKGYRWEDGSNIISKLRLIKSESEIKYQKKAAIAAAMGMKAAHESALAGVSEREMAANVCSAMILNGSDRAGPGVLSSGERAMYLHGGYTDRIFKKGDKIILTGFRVGEIFYGGYSQIAKVNGDFLVKKPKNLTSKQAMILGTAGFTSLMSAFAIKAREEILLGEKVKTVLVTGATGGVGSVAVIAPPLVSIKNPSPPVAVKLAVFLVVFQSTVPVLPNPD